MSKPQHHHIRCDELSASIGAMCNNHSLDGIPCGGVPDEYDFTRARRIPCGKEPPLKKLGYGFQGDPPTLKSLSIERHGFIWNGQKHYDKLSRAVIREVQSRMVESYELIAKPLEDDGSTIFFSSNVSDADTLIVLIQGSGAVRPGMWANSVCINNDLNSGSMLPVIETATAKGWGILVLDPNSGDKGCIHHTVSCWEQYVLPSRAAKNRKVLVLAHSNGGKCVMGLLRSHLSSKVLRSVARLAFTDAVHFKTSRSHKNTPEVIDFLANRTIDWVASEKPVNTPLQYASESKNVKEAARRYCTPYRGLGFGDPIPIRSAGHTKHVWTTAKSLKYVMKHLEGGVTRE